MKDIIVAAMWGFAFSAIFYAVLFLVWIIEIIS